MANHILLVLRGQAWERAKGELYAMLQTFYGEPLLYDTVNATIKEFISFIEDEGLQE